MNEFGNTVSRAEKKSDGLLGGEKKKMDDMLKKRGEKMPRIPTVQACFTQEHLSLNPKFGI